MIDRKISLYRIGERLGGGGMGEVHLADGLALDRSFRAAGVEGLE